MYRVKLTPTAVKMFNALHPTIKSRIKSRLKELYHDPFQGKALRDELSSFRSLKMKRYRAVYRVDHEQKEAVIYAIGHRRNIYETVSSLKQP